MHIFSKTPFIRQKYKIFYYMLRSNLQYTFCMPTFIELHLLTYFTMLLFLMLAIKMFLKTKANLFCIVVASAMFAVIKFLLDFYSVNMLWQILSLCIYVLAVTLVVHKLNHITKLVVSVFIFGLYYLCLLGINWFITAFILKQNINYISNFYLFIVIGLNFIVFSLFSVVTMYLQAEKSLKLTQKCFLTINNSKIELLGYLDTGNCLKEPKTSKDVVVVGIDSLKKHLTDKMYADLLFATNVAGVFSQISKLQYSTIGGSNSLTIFKPESFVINGKQIDCFVGVTIKKMQYDALLSSACV